MPYQIVSDGAEIAYDDGGAGRPLLLVHGWATHAGFFQRQVSALADRFRVIAVDLRGHGRSAGVPVGLTPAGLTVERLARDLCELADGLDLRDMLLVGWSMGAMVAWRALLDGLAPRVSGLVVVDMAPRVVNDGEWQSGLRGSHPDKTIRQAVTGMKANWSAVAPRISDRIFATGRQGEQADLRRWAEAEVERADPAAMAGLWTSLTAQDFRAALPRLDLPVLIAHGELSRLYPPATARLLADLLPRSTLVAFDRSGHAPHLEQPDQFNAALTQFAATLPPVRGGGPTNAGTAMVAGIQ